MKEPLSIIKNIKNQLNKTMFEINCLLSKSCLKIKNLSIITNIDLDKTEFKAKYEVCISDEYLLSEDHPINLDIDKFKNLIHIVFKVNKLDTEKILFELDDKMFCYNVTLN